MERPIWVVARLSMVYDPEFSNQPEALAKCRDCRNLSSAVRRSALPQFLRFLPPVHFLLFKEVGNTFEFISENFHALNIVVTFWGIVGMRSLRGFAEYPLHNLAR